LRKHELTLSTVDPDKLKKFLLLFDLRERMLIFSAVVVVCMAELFIIRAVEQIICNHINACN